MSEKADTETKKAEPEASTSTPAAGGSVGTGEDAKDTGPAKERPLVSREHEAAKEMLDKNKVDIGFTVSALPQMYLISVTR